MHFPVTPVLVHQPVYVAPEQVQHARVFHVALQLPEQDLVVEAGVVAQDLRKHFPLSSRPAPDLIRGPGSHRSAKVLSGRSRHEPKATDVVIKSGMTSRKGWA